MPPKMAAEESKVMELSTNIHKNSASFCIISKQSISVCVRCHLPRVRKFIHHATTMKMDRFWTKCTFSHRHYIFRLCHLPGEQDERHPMNQTILINYGILDIVFDLLYQEVDTELLVKMFDTN